MEPEEACLSPILEDRAASPALGLFEGTVLKSPVESIECPAPTTPLASESNVAGSPSPIDEVESQVLQELRELSLRHQHAAERAVRGLAHHLRALEAGGASFGGSTAEVPRFYASADSSIAQAPVVSAVRSTSLQVQRDSRRESNLSQKMQVLQEKEPNNRVSHMRGSRKLRASMSFGSHLPSPSKMLAAKTMRLSQLEKAGGLLYRARRWWSGLEEPRRGGWLARLVEDWRFELATFCVILLNAVVLVYQTDRAAQEALEKPQQGGSSLVEDVADYCFTAYFLCELLMKLGIHRLWFFWNADMGWNVFEFFAVSMALVDIAAGLAAESSRLQDSLKVLRVFRMLRTLRLLRALQVVKSLRQLVGCMLASFTGLFWCVLLLAFITCACALFLVQAVTFFWQDNGSPEPSEHLALQESFGSVGLATLSLFKATTGGEDWGYYYELTKKTGPMGPLVLCFYMLFFIIAAWNVVTSLFVETALEMAQPDAEAKMLQQLQQKQADARDLMRLLETVDEDGNGTISIEEFKKWMDDPRLQHFLEAKGVDIKDAELFFRMMKEATHSPEIELAVLANGLLRMRGLATNLDLQALQFSISHLFRVLDGKLRDVRSSLHGLAASRTSAKL